MTTSRYDDDGSSSRRNTQKEIDLMLLALPFPSAADQTLDDRAIKPPPSVRLLESPVTSLMSWHAVKAIRGARHSLPLFCFYFGGIKQETPFSRRRHVPLLSGAATVEPPDRINHGGCTRHYRPLVIDWKPLLPARLCFIADPFFSGTGERCKNRQSVKTNWKKNNRKSGRQLKNRSVEAESGSASDSLCRFVATRFAGAFAGRRIVINSTKL